MREGPKHDTLCLPDDLLKLHRTQFAIPEHAKLKYRSDVEQNELIEEERWEYLLEIYKRIDRIWDGCRPLVMRRS